MSTNGPDDEALERWLAGEGPPPADLARLLDALRVPVTSLETATQAEVVGQMVAVLTTSANPAHPARPRLRGRPVFSRFSRRSAVLAFAGTLAFGGAAVAASGTGVLHHVFGAPDRPALFDETSTSSEPDDSSTSAAPGDPTTSTDSTEPDGATTTVPVTCDSAENHGDWVSQAAHDESDDHAEHVRDAAHSDCGKPDNEGTDETGDTDDDAATDHQGQDHDADDANEGDEGDGAGQGQ